MPEVPTKFFDFRQNNSGGSFNINDAQGIGVKVWIEAVGADHANSRALNLGLYFDGCAKGMDCPCCGDRWYPTWNDDGNAEPEISEEYDFTWHDTVYTHRLDGTIERRTKSAA